MAAKLVGASPAEIKEAAALFAGIASRLSEELCEGDEPDFSEVKVLVWRAERALRELDSSLKWRLEVSGEQVEADALQRQGDRAGS